MHKTILFLLMYTVVVGGSFSSMKEPIILTGYIVQSSGWFFYMYK